MEAIKGIDLLAQLFHGIFFLYLSFFRSSTLRFYVNNCSFPISLRRSKCENVF